MEPTASNFIAISYAVPFSAFFIIFLFITMINRHSNWYILHSILGIDWKKDDKEKDETRLKSEHSGHCVHCGKSFTATVKTEANKTSEDLNNFNDENKVSVYLYIDFDEGEKKNDFLLPCYIRLFSDLLASAILAIFVSIIFSSVILENTTLDKGDKCPDYNASCFATIGTTHYGPYNCSKDNYANFSIDVDRFWCVGWVYKDKSAKDVLDTLGTCGGLLAIVASIVPLTYYLSYNRRKWWKISCLCIILPILPIAALGVALWLEWPRGISQLASTVFGVAIPMVVIGWCWGLHRSYKSKSDHYCRWLSYLLDPKCCSKEDYYQNKTIIKTRLLSKQDYYQNKTIIKTRLLSKQLL
ncbi:unnamed protein product [Rotaria sp. Silwood1]|nr:unnamed protein product [Rotaria sp. Silwood1]